MKAILVLCAVGVPAIWVSALLLRLREHRVDLAPSDSVFEGASRLWQVNVMRSANYDLVGRRLLRWYIFALVAQAAGIGIAAYAVLFVRR